MPIASDSNSGFVITGYPHDITNGTGTIGASGTLTASNPNTLGMTRKWLFIQNQSAVQLNVIVATTLNDGTASTTDIQLAPGPGGAGTPGGTYENYNDKVGIGGAISIVGASGSQLTALEKLV